MRFLNAAVSVVLAVRGIVALPAPENVANDNVATDETSAVSSSDDNIASSTASNTVKPKVVIISHVSLVYYA